MIDYRDHAADLILAGQIAKIIKRDRGEVLRAMRCEPGMRRLALVNRRRRQRDLTDKEKEEIVYRDHEGRDEETGYELRAQHKQHEAHMDASLRAVMIAKAMTEQGRPLLSEHELTKLITDYAMLSRSTNETPEAAFSRVFSANDATGLMFRKAVAVAKGLYRAA
jgi:hypothetical protein